MKKKSIVIFLIAVMIILNVLMLKEVQAIVFSSTITFSSEFVSGGDFMPYALYTPSTATDDEAIPLIVWLHGSGEVSYEVGESGFLNAGLPAVLNNWSLEGFNAYILCPQNDGSWNNETDAERLKSLLDNFISEYNIDTSKIVLAGHSMGGRGALYMAHQLPDYFSRLAVLSGYEPGINISEIAIPTIGFVGTTNAGEDSNSVNYMRNKFSPVFGSANNITIECSHGDVPRRAFTEDSNSNGRSDLIEWMYDGYNIQSGIYNNGILLSDTENGGGILEPIEELVVFLCDNVMQWLQDTFVTTRNIDRDDGEFDFRYSPAIIFSGKVPALDINFINPENKGTVEYKEVLSFEVGKKMKFDGVFIPEEGLITNENSQEITKSLDSPIEWNSLLYDDSYFEIGNKVGNSMPDEVYVFSYTETEGSVYLRLFYFKGFINTNNLGNGFLGKEHKDVSKIIRIP